jgi:hypothetical protein
LFGLIETIIIITIGPLLLKMLPNIPFKLWIIVTIIIIIIFVAFFYIGHGEQ